jgi:hypothetical protein
MKNELSSAEFPAGSIYQVSTSTGAEALSHERLAVVRTMKSKWAGEQLFFLLKVEKQREVSAHIAGNQEVFADMFVS